jgi:hypothetical protein
MQHGRILIETICDIAVLGSSHPGAPNAFGHTMRETITIAMDRAPSGFARWQGNHRGGRPGLDSKRQDKAP